MRPKGGSLHQQQFVAGLSFPSTVFSSCFASEFSSKWLNRDISWSSPKLPFPGKSAKIEAGTSNSRVDLCRECRWSGGLSDLCSMKAPCAGISTFPCSTSRALSPSPLFSLNTLCQDQAEKVCFHATQLRRCGSPGLQVCLTWSWPSSYLNTGLPSCAPFSAVLPPDLTSLLQIPPHLFLTLPGPSHPCSHACPPELPTLRCSIHQTLIRYCHFLRCAI